MNQVEWVIRKAAGQEYDGRSSIKDKGKDKVKELPKRIINILAPEKVKVPVEEKSITALIVVANEAQKRPTTIELPK